MNSQSLLEMRDIHKTFGDHKAIDGMSLTIERNEKVCIIGPSGSGKSTFLRCCNLLEIPTQGEVLFDGKSIGNWGPNSSSKVLAGRQLNSFRSRMAMVFQHFELFPHLSVLQNIILGPVKTLGTPRKEAEEKAQVLLKRFGLERYANARPRMLSGGQQQRVAILRGVAMSPALMLFDEPTSALDPEIVGEVLDLIRELALADMTMLIVTHEMAFAREVADKVIVMDHGRIVESGPPDQLFSSAKEERTRRFLSASLSRGSSLPHENGI